MESLPYEIINHITSYFPIADLKSLSNLSQTSKYINRACQYSWKILFNKFFSYLFLTTDNYNRLFMKYYKLFSLDNPLLEADDEAIQQLNDLGLDSINIPPWTSIYNVKSNNLGSLFKDYPYSSKQIVFVLCSLIHDIGDKLPDINSGREYPTGKYIARMLKINSDESISKLYKTIDRYMLIKWLFIQQVQPISDRFSSVRPVNVDPPILRLARMLKPTFEELLGCLGEVVNSYNYQQLKYIFKLKRSSLVRFAIYQLDIQKIFELNFAKFKTKDKFCLYILDTIYYYTADISLSDNYDMIELYSWLINNQEIHGNMIKKIIYRTFKYNNNFIKYLYRAAIWRTLSYNHIFLVHPFKLRHSYKLYKFIMPKFNNRFIDMFDFRIHKNVINNYNLFKSAINITSCDYKEYYDYILSKPDLVARLEQIVKVYGIRLTGYQNDEHLINQMDIIADLPLNNNYHNIYSYISECVRKRIHNGILDKLFSRPECIGILVDLWPSSKEYIDKLNIKDKKMAYKTARRAINLFQLNKFSKPIGLEYLLDKLIAKTEVDRYLIRLFKDKFVAIFPHRKVNIDDIIFDANAILNFPEKYIDNIDKIINKYIDIFPLSCEILINRFWNKGNYQTLLKDNPMYKINKIINTMLSTELYSIKEEDIWFLL